MINRMKLTALVTCMYIGDRLCVSMCTGVDWKVCQKHLKESKRNRREKLKHWNKVTSSFIRVPTLNFIMCIYIVYVQLFRKPRSKG